MNDVNMCHGSRCMNEPTRYIPYVAAKEITMLRKVALVATRLSQDGSGMEKVGRDRATH